MAATEREKPWRDTLATLDALLDGVPDAANAAAIRAMFYKLGRERDDALREAEREKHNHVAMCEKLVEWKRSTLALTDDERADMIATLTAIAEFLQEFDE